MIFQLGVDEGQFQKKSRIEYHVIVEAVAWTHLHITIRKSNVLWAVKEARLNKYSCY